MRRAFELSSYQKTPQSHRQWCQVCGGHILTEHPELGLTDVYAAILPELAFTPDVHVHYQDTVLRIHEGVEKYKDLPEDIGGSGERIAE